MGGGCDWCLGNLLVSEVSLEGFVGGGGGRDKRIAEGEEGGGG